MMISVVQKSDDIKSWTFEVSVSENDEKTTHIVHLGKDYYKTLDSKKHSPKELIKRSFEFLLKKEPKEDILEEFDLSLIQHYFSEFEETI